MGAETQDDNHPFHEEKGFDQLLIGEQQFLRTLIRMIGVPASDVGDVLQDANVYLVSNQSKYLPGTNFRAWAAQVVRFRSLNYFRSRKRRPMVNLSEQALDLIAQETAICFEESHGRLRRLSDCLAKLPYEQRHLLDTVYAKGCSMKDLARRQRCSHAAMRKIISRIRHALKACIESHHES